ncbi:hypothetical protein FH608_046290 [Nonomuraea phyllanthi]|uniref:Uncharacterized protein n=1 Tax=Nonomuraea phyllanthi TaxID=2219224 RepID=A0A5C4V7C4_9ACTN|nr:hypothetical protein [Nonomuraea phyllanthi]KAB8186905.1 hypothetical protein FH608_046290 [Nonomuraea phyllanthi]
MPDFTVPIRKLATLNDTSPYERVFVIRQILDRVYREGYDEGYTRAMGDRGTADLIADDQDRKDAAGERTRIARHFDDMVITREWRRRFEDRHAEHLGDGVTVQGVLKAVIDEIKGMDRA